MAKAASVLESGTGHGPKAVPVERNLSRKSSTLGLLWIGYGMVRFVAVAVLIVYSSTATLMFGALLARVPDPFALMSAFHFLYLVGIGLAAAAGLFSIIGGWALINGSAPQRLLAIIAALLSVSDLPLGTTLGAYTLALFVPRVR